MALKTVHVHYSLLKTIQELLNVSVHYIMELKVFGKHIYLPLFLVQLNHMIFAMLCKLTVFVFVWLSFVSPEPHRRETSQ